MYKKKKRQGTRRSIVQSSIYQLQLFVEIQVLLYSIEISPFHTLTLLPIKEQTEGKKTSITQNTIKKEEIKSTCCIERDDNKKMKYFYSMWRARKEHVNVQSLELTIAEPIHHTPFDILRSFHTNSDAATNTRSVWPCWLTYETCHSLASVSLAYWWLTYSDPLLSLHTTVQFHIISSHRGG